MITFEDDSFEAIITAGEPNQSHQCHDELLVIRVMSLEEQKNCPRCLDMLWIPLRTTWRMFLRHLFLGKQNSLLEYCPCFYSFCCLFGRRERVNVFKPETEFLSRMRTLEKQLTNQTGIFVWLITVKNIIDPLKQLALAVEVFIHPKYVIGETRDNVKSGWTDISWSETFVDEFSLVRSIRTSNHFPSRHFIK